MLRALRYGVELACMDSSRRALNPVVIIEARDLRTLSKPCRKEKNIKCLGKRLLASGRMDWDEQGNRTHRERVSRP
jgi:hypothetical protein